MGRHGTSVPALKERRFDSENFHGRDAISSAVASYASSFGATVMRVGIAEIRSLKDSGRMTKCGVPDRGDRAWRACPNHLQNGIDGGDRRREQAHAIGRDPGVVRHDTVLNAVR